MASELEQSIVRIGEKSRILVERYKTVVAQRDRALELKRELEARIQACEKTIAQLRQQVEYLTIASNIAPTRDSLEAARTTISELVREIDRCIADIAE